MRVLSMDDAVLGKRPDLSIVSDQPAHARIAAWLEKLIVSGRLAPGDKLPAEVDIAAALGVSRMTLRQALGAIEAKGLIRRSRGRFGGNFVETSRLEFDHTGMPGFTEQLRRLDMAAGAQVVSATTRVPRPEVREALGLSRGARVHEIIRIRSADGAPVLLEETYLPAGLFPGLLSADLTGSVYALMADEFGIPLFSADEHIEAATATAARAELLGVAEGDPLLLVTRTAHDRDGVPVEFSHDYFRSDRTRIRVKSWVDRDTQARVETSPAS
ncbi:GntR family transcriptional regulator [Mycobacterium sp. DL592]|uniref:GntR family transcriptional regulator n=1 Tax=Mycobacterium sp. DL592 TaxID=2675524 RepID=UPI001420EC99|nr:GntR family transcriptional regulator [Mycobacterium sp. DL592]